MKKKKSTLAVMTKVRELTKYVFEATEKSPKKFRFTLCTKLENYCLNTIELIYKANSMKEIDKRIELQEKAKTYLAMIDYFANLSYELTCITFKQYEVISLNVALNMKLLIAWMNQAKKQLVINSPCGDLIKG